MNLINAYYVAWITDHVFTWTSLPEVWRFISPFFITGPQFGLLMDPYFLWTYSSQLELEATRFSQPGDFFTYITFVCSVIVVSCGNLSQHIDMHRLLPIFLSFGTPTSLTARPVYLSCDGS
jgi:Derlin-2/3